MLVNPSQEDKPTKVPSGNDDNIEELYEALDTVADNLSSKEETFGANLKKSKK